MAQNPNIDGGNVNPNVNFNIGTLLIWELCAGGNEFEPSDLFNFFFLIEKTKITIQNLCLIYFPLKWIFLLLIVHQCIPAKILMDRIAHAKSNSSEKNKKIPDRQKKSILIIKLNKVTKSWKRKKGTN